MYVIIDERETALYDKCVEYLATMSNLAKENIYIMKSVLCLGDIVLKKNLEDEKELVIIERKTLADLLASIKDGRYVEQSYRLVNTSIIPMRSIFYLVEGMFSQLRNPDDKRIIFSTMTSLQAFKGFNTQRTATVAESAEWILIMADKLTRDINKGKQPFLESHQYNSPTATAQNYCNVVKKVKKDNITQENIGEIILCQIPGISAKTATAIMKQFQNSFPVLLSALRENPDCLDGIILENEKPGGKSRKINKTSIASIYQYLVKNNTQSTSTGIADGP
jgi:crossover junction endonuclease MUS81